MAIGFSWPSGRDGPLPGSLASLASLAPLACFPPALRTRASGWTASWHPVCPSSLPRLCTCSQHNPTLHLCLSCISAPHLFRSYCCVCPCFTRIVISWDEDDYTESNQILVSLLDPNSDIFTAGKGSGDHVPGSHAASSVRRPKAHVHRVVDAVCSWSPSHPAPSTPRLHGQQPLHPLLSAADGGGELWPGQPRPRRRQRHRVQVQVGCHPSLPPQRAGCVGSSNARCITTPTCSLPLTATNT
jgi:hypothetical protein